MTIVGAWTTTLIAILFFSHTFVSVNSSPNADGLSQLIDLSKAGNGIARVNDGLFDTIFDGPRNFSVTLVLTALGSEVQCPPCHIFAVDYQLIARQWSKQPTYIRNSHFFAVIDYKEGKKTFAKLGLQTVPHARVLLPTEGPNAVADVDKQEQAEYDFNSGDVALTAERFSKWATEAANLPQFFTRPPNYAKIAAITLVVLTVTILMKLVWPNAKKILLTGRFIWAAVLLPLTLLMISGQMWCQIRSAPYMARIVNGPGSYLAKGYSNQFGVEVLVIASLYGVLAFAAYTLAFTVSKFDDPPRQRIAIYIWLAVFMGIASLLMNIFRLKHGSYPFKIFF